MSEDQDYNEQQPDEWACFVDIEEIEDGPLILEISPDEEETAILARRLGIKSLDSLEADIRIKREAGGATYYVKGSLKAKVTQECVVSLDPVHSDIKESFEAWYANPESVVSLTKARHDRDAKGERPMLEEEQDPETVTDGKINIGELVTQYLSLAIDPYPHAEGVERGDGDKRSSDDGGDMMRNPFAALKDWKDRKR